MRNWIWQLSKPRVLVISGPTGVGKTALSIDLAKRLNGEIISADSVQVYRGLDIGSSKITEEEMQGIRHHLISICDPHEEYDSGRFAKEARKATDEILKASPSINLCFYFGFGLKRGKTPIVVGGTGFYLKWYVHGAAKTKKSTKESRKRARDYLDSMWEKARSNKGEELDEHEKWSVGIEALERAGDLEAAKRQDNNYYRLYRALEIILENEGEMSQFSVDTSKPLDYDFRCFFLVRPRLEIYHRIEIRCEEMLQQGILAESARLLEAGIAPNTNCATRSIGYRQSMNFLQKLKNGEIELNIDTTRSFIMEFEAATRKLVKQQITWFRSDRRYRWVDLASQTYDPKDLILKDWRKLRLFPTDNKEQGALSREEEKMLKQYQPVIHYYKDNNKISELVKQIQSLLRH
eukprot:g573.t1